MEVTTLADTAWRLGELDRHIGTPDIEGLIVESVYAAEDELTYGTTLTISLAMIEQARALLLARHDGEMAARERALADAPEDAVEAGDRTRDGEVAVCEVSVKRNL